LHKVLIDSWDDSQTLCGKSLSKSTTADLLKKELNKDEVSRIRGFLATIDGWVDPDPAPTLKPSKK
jgi:hypothetical protein